MLFFLRHRNSIRSCINNKNNNNNTRTIYHNAIIYGAKPYATVHLGLLSKSRSAPGGHQLVFHEKHRNMSTARVRSWDLSSRSQTCYHYTTSTRIQCNRHNTPSHPGLRSAACSAPKFVVPRLRTKFSERAFSFSGPVAWNSLPACRHPVHDEQTSFQNVTEIAFLPSSF